MKHNISLSLKTTLLTALPCLALSLFAVSCSDDESAVVSGETATGKIISFTAVAPEVTDYTTRIGLDETNLPSSGADPEPIIWLEGDKIAFNFVKYGEPTGQVIEYTASNVRNGGLSCDFRTDQEMDLENGLYRVYVVGPSIATTFQGGAVSGTAIDLRGQSQPGVTANYRNLSDYYYQHAYTILEIEDNEVVEGSTNLTFKGLTSMLRYRITSELTSNVQVVRIKFSHLGTSESQFYTRGTFDPSSDSSIETVGNPVSSLGLTTAHQLGSNSQFNAYMTLIPTAGFASGNSDQLSATVYFYLGGVLYKRVWSWGAPSVSNNGKFLVSSRTLFSLTLRPGEYVSADLSELLDEEEDDSTQPTDPELEGYELLEYDGYYFTPSHYMSDKTGSPIQNWTQLTKHFSDDDCPAGWSLFQAGSPWASNLIPNPIAMGDALNLLDKYYDLNTGVQPLAVHGYFLYTRSQPGSTFISAVGIRTKDRPGYTDTYPSHITVTTYPLNDINGEPMVMWNELLLDLRCFRPKN